MPSERLRVLAVSHSAVIPVNQEPFHALGLDGADVTVVVPEGLRSDLRGSLRFEPLEGFAGRLVPVTAAVGGYRRALGGQRGIHLIVYRGLDRAIDAARPDVLFVEEEPFSFAARQAASIAASRKIPLVVHENQNIDRRLPLPFQAIRRWVLRQAAGVTVRNDAAAALVRAHGFRGLIGSLPHAVEPARYEGHARATDLPEPVIGFVGRLVPEKGLLDVIVAIEQAGIGSLLVVGDGPAREEAERRAAAIPARFVGAVPHDEVPAWYASMDVVAIPSHTTTTWKEQFGRIVIEANAAGVPVIVTDSGALPETVAATGGGLVVGESDVAALADAIASLGKDAGRRGALGAAGRAAVAERFTPAAVARAFHRFLREVAA